MLFFAVLLAIVAFTGAEYEGKLCQVPSYRIEGVCTSIHKCPKARRAFDTTPLRREMVDYLRELQCGFAGYTQLVCCSDQIDISSVTPPTVFKPNPTKRPTRPPPVSKGNGLLPTEDECGKDFAGNRIYNGKITDIDEFPWMALLGYKTKDGHRAFECGGALISKRYVLTAAHCLVGAINQVVGRLEVVRLGEYDLQSERDCIIVGGYEDCADPYQDIPVEDYVAHHNFSDANVNRKDDIGLVRLFREAQYTDFVQPICLPSPGRSASDELLIVAGWGRTHEGVKSDIKLKLIVPWFDKRECDNLYTRANAILTPNQICAGGQNAKDACNGDSGGPLMYQRGLNWYTYGIVSFGNGCGREGWPGIYTDVSKYIGWINSNIRR